MRHTVRFLGIDGFAGYAHLSALLLILIAGACSAAMPTPSFSLPPLAHAAAQIGMAIAASAFNLGIFRRDHSASHVKYLNYLGFRRRDWCVLLSALYTFLALGEAWLIHCTLPFAHTTSILLLAITIVVGTCAGFFTLPHLPSHISLRWHLSCPAKPGRALAFVLARESGAHLALTLLPFTILGAIGCHFVGIAPWMPTYVIATALAVYSYGLARLQQSPRLAQYLSYLHLSCTQRIVPMWMISTTVAIIACLPFLCSALLTGFHATVAAVAALLYAGLVHGAYASGSIRLAYRRSLTDIGAYVCAIVALAPCVPLLAYAYRPGATHMKEIMRADS